jgi:hypothetical protein
MSATPTDSAGAQVDAGGACRLAFAAAFLALLVGAIVVSFWVAKRNFEIADFARTPKAKELLAAIEGDEARTMTARWFASESNRALFAMVGPIQLVCAAAAFLLGHAAAAGRARAPLMRGLLWIELVLALGLAPLVPWMIAHGRAIDFVSRAQGNPPEVQSFLAWHGVYFAGDLALLVGALLLVVLLSIAAGAPRHGVRP